MKKSFDILFSSVILFLSIPIFLLCAVLIKMTSKGPVFFRHKRIGKNGKEFTLFKFRTMGIKQGPLITPCEDERITKVGRILRGLKLDELPQFINVLRGEMSVVGPRPEIPEIVIAHRDKFNEILFFTPGITSPASLRFSDESKILSRDTVMEYYVNKILPKKIKYDLIYFRNNNFLSDIKIIAKTAIHIFKR